MTQPARALPLWDENSLRAAERSIVATWSSVEEKLAALAVVVEHRNVASLDVLQQALLMVGLSRPIQRVDRLLGVAKGGEVAGAAARALAAYAEIGGLSAMEELLFDEGTSRTIRETVAYGLGGSSHPAVFDLYAKALGIWDPDVRFRLLLSLRESLDRTVEVDSVPIQRALLRLCDLLVIRMSELRGGEQDVIVSILSRFGTGETEERLTNALTECSDLNVLTGVFEVLTRRGTKSSRGRLARVFRSEDRPARLYLLLKEELRLQIDADALRAARAIVGTYPLKRWVLSLFSAAERHRREAHLGAAQALLDAKPAATR